MLVNAEAHPLVPQEFSERIAGGTHASRGEFPFIVQIKRGNSQSCAGSLVNSQWILTAAQ